MAGIGGFVEINGAVVYYGYNSVSLLLALLGIAAFATRQRGLALAYTIVLGMITIFGLALAIMLGVAIGAASSVANQNCDQFSAGCDTANVFVGTVGIIVAAVFGVVTCINLMCLGCGVGYYRELKHWSPTTYVVLPSQAQTNIHIHNQVQQGAPPQFAPPTTYTPTQPQQQWGQPPQQYQPPVADVPGVFTKQ